MFDQDILSSAGPLSDPNGPWPPATPAEIPLSELEIEATGILLKNWLARHPVRPTTKTIADHPEVARHYFPELNGGVAANHVPRFLGIDVVWRCDAVPGETHLWSAKPQNFTRAVLKQLQPSLVPDDQSEMSVRRVHGAKSLRFNQLRDAGHSPTHGCPGCSGRMATTGNNLKRAFPMVSDYWDFEMNAYGPELYLPRSTHEVYWLDPTSGRRSRASILSRTQRNKIGTNRQDCGLEACETNNLALVFPQVAARLVSTADGSAVDPCTVSPRSNRYMFWRCKETNHPNFKAQVDTMVRAELAGTRPQGCSACRGFTLAPGGSLADLHPEIAADYERAGTNPLPATEIIPGTDAPADFSCGTCGHLWNVPLQRRTRMDQGCPACFGAAVTAANNLAVRFPELAKEWHPDNPMQPDELRPSHDRAVMWICKKNPAHVWTARPADRTRKGGGTDCPHCDPTGVSKEQVRFFSALKARLPTLEYETEGHVPEICRLAGTRFVFDAVIPEYMIALEYDGLPWHERPEHFERDRRKNAAAAAQGITVIRIRLALEAIGPHDITVGKRPNLSHWVELTMTQVTKVIALLKKKR